jgi:hypothetical protein
MADQQSRSDPRPDEPVRFAPGAVPQGVLDLQRAYYQGEIPREAALASAVLVYKFTPFEAERLFPKVAPVQPVRSWWLEISTALGAIGGAIFAAMLVTRLSYRSDAVVPHGWEELAMFVGLIAGTLVGAILGPVVRLGMMHIWRRHVEAS